MSSIVDASGMLIVLLIAPLMIRSSGEVPVVVMVRLAPFRSRAEAMVERLDSELGR